MIVVAALVLGVFIVGGMVLVYKTIRETRHNLTDQATAFSLLSVKPISETYVLYFDSGYLKFKEITSSILDLDKSITKIQIIDVNGKILFDSDYMAYDQYLSASETAVDLDVLENVLSNEPVYVKNPKVESENIEIFQPYFTNWGSHPFTVRYFVSYNEVRQNIVAIIINVLILVLITVSLTVMLITGTVNRLILTPITQLSSVAQNIAKGKYGERISIDTNDEIEDLSLATNKMATTLEQNIEDLKELDKLKDEFIDIAANNLKIPLNHLKFNIKYLLKDGKRVRKEQELLEDVEVNVNKLQLLSEDLINVTAIKSTSENNIFMPIDLVFVLNEVLRDVKTTLVAAHLSAETDFSSPAIVLGDYLKVKQVFFNLIDNAIKFSPTKGGKIKISLYEKDNSFIVEIADEGVGIDEKEIPKLFQKFYRAPSSAIYNKEGAGLGLYLAKLIVDLHHGSIWVKSEKGKGSTFSVSLPQKEAEMPIL